MASDTTINKSIFIAATPEEVWPYLTDKDKLGMWFHPADRDLAAGDDYACTGQGESNARIWGRVLTMEPPRKLTYTFQIPPFGDAETTVTWELAPVPGGTRVSLRHEGIAEACGDMPPMPLLTALDEGWDKHLAALRQKP